jgi:hypothetical protein
VICNEETSLGNLFFDQEGNPSRFNGGVFVTILPRSNRARSASFPEICRQLLLGMPHDGGGVKSPHAGSHHRPAQRMPAQPRKNENVGLTVEDRVDIFQADPSGRALPGLGWRSGGRALGVSSRRGKV